MQITKLIIENYRSIKKVEIRLSPLFGLIGANSSGKSNILRALNLVLGEYYPTSNYITKKDFYNEDFNNDIKIIIYFDQTFVSYGAACSGVCFYTSHNNDDGSVAKEGNFTCELKAIVASTGQLQKYRMNGISREDIPIIYIPAARNFDLHLFGDSKWSLRGRLITEFNRNFPSERVNTLYDSFSSVKSVLKTDQFNDFENSFKSAFSEHIIPTENEVEVEFKPFDPKNYYKTIEIVPTEHTKLKNIDQIGDGIKNLILIALFRAYANTFPKSTVFLIEEPEIYLHPQGRTDLFKVFESLSNNGSQIIYTTHSQEFLDISKFSFLGVVRKSFSGGEHNTKVVQINDAIFLEKWKTCNELKTATLESLSMFLKRINDAETNRGLFAKKVLIVEGQTDKWLLEEYAKKVDFNLEKNNIEIVNARGKPSILPYYLIYKELEYPIYVIFDADSSKSRNPEINKRLVRVILGSGFRFENNTVISDRVAIFKEDLETELKSQIPNYTELEREARAKYGIFEERNKEIIARHIAFVTEPPEFIKNIFSKLKPLE